MFAFLLGVLRGRLKMATWKLVGFLLRSRRILTVMPSAECDKEEKWFFVGHTCVWEGQRHPRLASRFLGHLHCLLTCRVKRELTCLSSELPVTDVRTGCS